MTHKKGTRRYFCFWFLKWDDERINKTRDYFDRKSDVSWSIYILWFVILCVWCWDTIFCPRVIATAATSSTSLDNSVFQKYYFFIQKICTFCSDFLEIFLSRLLLILDFVGKFSWLEITIIFLQRWYWMILKQNITLWWKYSLVQNIFENCNQIKFCVNQLE